MEDFDADLIEQLEALSTMHDFLIFEDRKFADIGARSFLGWLRSATHVLCATGD